jgi:hypothetical protein
MFFVYGYFGYVADEKDYDAWNTEVNPTIGIGKVKLGSKCRSLISVGE